MKAIIIISCFILASQLGVLEICTVNSLSNICTRMLFKTIMKKKSAARPCGIGCVSSRFQGRSSRNTPLQQCDSNERSRLGRGALRDDPKNGCEGDNILTVAFFNIEDITWSHGDTNFVQRVLKNIQRVSASNPVNPSFSQFLPISEQV